MQLRDRVASPLSIPTADMDRLSKSVGGRFLGVGAFAVAAYAMLQPSFAADVVFMCIAVAAGVAVFHRVGGKRPAAPGAWRAIGASLALLAVANGLALVARLGAFPPARDIADVLFLLAYVPLYVGAFKFTRGLYRSDGVLLLDTAIVGVAAAPVVWAFIVEPEVRDAVTGAAAIALALPMIDIVLFSVVATLVLTRAGRSWSSVLLLAGIAAQGAADTAFGMSMLRPGWAPIGVINLAWLVAYILLGAAALAPSARGMGRARPAGLGGPDRPRLAILGVAALVPATLLFRAAWTGETMDLGLLALLSVVVTVLVALRLGRTVAELAATEGRFRRFMGNPGILAVIKDRRGRYVYMNATAQRAHVRGAGWYGRTADELFDPATAERVRLDDEIVRTEARSRLTTHQHGDRTWLAERFLLPNGHGSIGVLEIDVTERLRAERESRFQAMLLESVRDAVIVVDIEQRIQYWNAGAEEILGYTSAEVLGRPAATFRPPGTDGEDAERSLTLEQGGSALADWQAIARDGRTVWLQARITVLTDEEGIPTGYLCVATDVTERKHAEIELARLGTAIGNAPDAVIVSDEEDRIVYVNPAYEQMTGHAAAELRGRRVSELPGGRSFARALADARAGTSGWRGDLVERRRDGGALVAETTIAPIDVDGEAAGFVTIKRDVTADRASERAARRRSRERTLIAETLGALQVGESPEATAAAICSQFVKLPEVALGSVMVFGLDGCASVLGQVARHGAGVPGLILTRARSDFLRDRASAGPWVERCRSDAAHPYTPLFAELAIAAHAYAPIVVGGRLMGILIASSDHPDAVARLTERLPALLEWAAIAGTLLGSALAERHAVAARADDLRGVIKEGAFWPVFQPIVDLGSGNVLGYEALTRFADGTPPDVRFQQAHELGLGLELEAATLHAAFEAARGLPHGAWLNVNVTPACVMAGRCRDLLAVGDRSIVVEVTEHEVIDDYGAFRAAIAPLRDRIRIAVDDAGAGYASLRHVVELDPSMVKIDRSLVDGIDSDGARQAVVSGMVRFARTAGLELIAEGIERPEEREMLRRLGVTLGQGYLLGMPLPASALAAPTHVSGGPPPQRPTARSTGARRDRAATPVA